MSFITNTLGGLIGDLSGATYDANNTGSYYQNAMNQLVNSTGSPAAQQFGAEESASLKPLFNQQDQNLAAKEAAMGITNSGAAKNDFSNLTAQQSATLAGAVAPLYQSAIGSYGSLAGEGAGAQSSAYQHALDQFYNSLQMAGAGSSNPYGG